MSERKTPYVFGKRIGPDMAVIVAEQPQHCTVHYKGNWFKYMTCVTCQREYWRRYGGVKVHLTSATNPRNTYCSEPCAAEGRRVQTRLRQARWKAKKRARR